MMINEDTRRKLRELNLNEMIETLDAIVNTLATL